MIAKQSKSTQRKTTTKLRKPKYLSLRRQLTAPPPPPPMPTTDHRDQKQVINLFPLHPENLVEQDNMACIFSSCDDVTTLTGILCNEEKDNTNNPSPSSVNYAEEEVELVRAAMRRNKTDKINDHENWNEKWVCYSEVVDRKKVITELSSSSSTIASCNDDDDDDNIDHHHGTKLVLKLDYEKIMKSWVNKGPLYVHGNSGVDAPQPQTVPDLQDDGFFLPSSINVTTRDEQDNDDNGGSWTVPEMAHIENKAGESSTMAHNREASVLRYKEKRRNRLFAKTVRYEVRKLNAEKRPRIKGRFVKIN